VAVEGWAGAVCGRRMPDVKLRGSAPQQGCPARPCAGARSSRPIGDGITDRRRTRRWAFFGRALRADGRCTRSGRQTRAPDRCWFFFGVAGPPDFDGPEAPISMLTLSCTSRPAGPAGPLSPEVSRSGRGRRMRGCVLTAPVPAERPASPYDQDRLAGLEAGPRSAGAFLPVTRFVGQPRSTRVVPRHYAFEGLSLFEEL